MPSSQTHPTPGSPDRTLPAAAAVLSQHRAENFPVALWILPRGLREDLLNLYGFARLVDDVGDELAGDRLAALAQLDAELDTLFAGGTPEHPLLVRVARTVREKRLSEEPFRQLIEANRIDQRVQRYASWPELEDYCRHSANPVGRLVLEVLEVRTPAAVAYADRICTGLQLAEHCQDVREDLVEKGRIYLPGEDLARFEVGEADLRASRASPRVRALLRFEARRTRELLHAGAPLLGMLRGYARLAVAGFLAGGHAALDAIQAANGDVLVRTPRPARSRVVVHLVAGFAGSRR